MNYYSEICWYIVVCSTTKCCLMSSEVVTFFVDSGKIFSLTLPLFAFMYNDLASLFDADDICIVQSCSG